MLEQEQGTPQVSEAAGKRPSPQMPVEAKLTCHWTELGISKHTHAPVPIAEPFAVINLNDVYD